MRRPRVYCDFNGLVDEDTYALDSQGTLDDMQRLGLELKEGLALTLWADDVDDEGNDDNLLVDGVVAKHENFDWVARVDARTWRHESDERG